jgi:hypothetical protein
VLVLNLEVRVLNILTVSTGHGYSSKTLISLIVGIWNGRYSMCTDSRY